MIDDGHQVVVHARIHHRAADLSDLADRGAAVVVGNLADLKQTRSVADQVNAHDLTWSSQRWHGTQAYCDSKLYITAHALAVARRWPDVISPRRRRTHRPTHRRRQRFALLHIPLFALVALHRRPQRESDHPVATHNITCGVTDV